jgi:hypothetical protein
MTSSRLFIVFPLCDGNTDSLDVQASAACLAQALAYAGGDWGPQGVNVLDESVKVFASPSCPSAAEHRQSGPEDGGEKDARREGREERDPQTAGLGVEQPATFIGP